MFLCAVAVTVVVFGVVVVVVVVVVTAVVVVVVVVMVVLLLLLLLLLQQLAQAGLEAGTAVEVRGRGEGTVVEHHRYMLGANEHSVDFGDKFTLMAVQSITSADLINPVDRRPRRQAEPAAGALEPRQEARCRRHARWQR